jgi:hypothetical protein
MSNMAQSVTQAPAPKFARMRPTGPPKSPPLLTSLAFASILNRKCEKTAFM